MRKRKRRLLLLGSGSAVLVMAIAVSAVSAGASSSPSSGTSKGPSTPTNPYLLPVADGVHVKSLLTVDDAGAAENGYEMVGIPDGLGASRDGGNDFTLYMNHELVATSGIVRRHGQRGAFVAKLEIDRRSFEVEEGSDLVDPGVTYWDYVSQTFGPTPSAGGVNPRNTADTFPAQLAAFGRWCSSSLTDEGQLYNKDTKRGYRLIDEVVERHDGCRDRHVDLRTEGARPGDDPITWPGHPRAQPASRRPSRDSTSPSPRCAAAR